MQAMREGNTFESVNLNMNWVKWANNKSDDQNTQEEVLVFIFSFHLSDLYLTE